MFYFEFDVGQSGGPRPHSVIIKLFNAWRFVKDNDLPERSSLRGLIGFAMLGLCVIGMAAAFVALLALTRSDFVGGGVSLVASALSFGLLLNGVVRS